MNSLLLLLFFVMLVGLLWKLSTAARTAHLFRVVPVPFWCYLLPMIGTTLGWIPTTNSLYPFLSQQLLPVCLFLLLIGTDLKGIARLGPAAITLMLVGAIGTILGGLISFWLYRRWLPAGSWMDIGALAASWTGGSANLLAVKEALRIPDPLIAPIIIVDALVAYSWMALLIAGAALATRWDRAIAYSRSGPPGDAPLEMSQRDISRFGIRPGSSQEIKDAGDTVPARPTDDALPSRPSREIIYAALPAGSRDKQTILRGNSGSWSLALGIALAIGLSLAAQALASHLPTLGQIMTSSTWAILLVTSITLFLSLTPLAKLEPTGASRLGSFLLYILLASIGARATLASITQSPIFLLLGLTWILIHGLCLLAAGWLMKSRLGLIAAASQANVGGPISASIVGATYSRELASIGLLMAVLGNLLGTYLGLTTAAIAFRFLAP